MCRTARAVHPGCAAGRAWDRRPPGGGRTQHWRRPEVPPGGHRLARRRRSAPGRRPAAERSAWPLARQHRGQPAAAAASAGTAGGLIRPQAPPCQHVQIRPTFRHDRQAVGTVACRSQKIDSYVTKDTRLPRFSYTAGQRKICHNRDTEATAAQITSGNLQIALTVSPKFARNVARVGRGGAQHMPVTWRFPEGISRQEWLLRSNALPAGGHLLVGTGGLELSIPRALPGPPACDYPELHAE